MKPSFFLKKQKIGIVCTVLMALLLLLSGCALGDDDDAKLRDLEFTVVSEADVPQELQTIIAEKRNQPFKMTYTDARNLYIVVGYGPQSTGGYSIQVEELYLTPNAIFLDTELIGPAKGAPAAPETSYPIIIIRTELLEEPVIFD